MKQITLTRYTMPQSLLEASSNTKMVGNEPCEVVVLSRVKTWSSSEEVLITFDVPEREDADE